MYLFYNRYDALVPTRALVAIVGGRHLVLGHRDNVLPYDIYAVNELPLVPLFEGRVLTVM